MEYIVPILRGPINTQYIPILAGVAEWQSSNLFQYLQKSCSRIVGVSTRPVRTAAHVGLALLEELDYGALDDLDEAVGDRVSDRPVA